MFRFTRKPSSGSHSQYLDKITHLVQCRYIELVQDDGCSNMFRFTRKPSSGNHSQYSAKITHLVKSRYLEAVQDVVSVMAAYCDL